MPSRIEDYALIGGCETAGLVGKDGSLEWLCLPRFDSSACFAAWMADNYVLLGRQEEAEELFARLLGLCNDVGLISERYDPYGRRVLGNVPQAFTHVGLINTAMNLMRKTNNPPEHRGD